ncbi:hypothetical protein C8R47DRAFT_1122389 [Mycena vitilis]|nr:hypothetical protein C8R47DRAFT_1122389 [Mycena vitilis]
MTRFLSEASTYALLAVTVLVGVQSAPSPGLDRREGNNTSVYSGRYQFPARRANVRPLKQWCSEHRITEHTAHQTVATHSPSGYKRGLSPSAL